MPEFSLQIIKTSDFEKTFDKLPANLQKLVIKKITLFKNNPRNPQLRTHKLKSELKKFYSFSINRKYRILFEFLNRNKALFYDIGTHEIYK